MAHPLCPCVRMDDKGICGSCPHALQRALKSGKTVMQTLRILLGVGLALIGFNDLIAFSEFVSVCIWACLGGWVGGLLGGWVHGWVAAACLPHILPRTAEGSNCRLCFGPSFHAAGQAVGTLHEYRYSPAPLLLLQQSSSWRSQSTSTSPCPSPRRISGEWTLHIGWGKTRWKRRRRASKELPRWVRSHFACTELCARGRAQEV